MGMFTNSTPPSLPSAPVEYDVRYMQQLLGILRLFFNKIGAVQGLNLATLNLNLDTLPTEAALATLREGDVYRDSTASNVLKVKV